MKKPYASLVTITYDQTASYIKKTIEVLKKQTIMDFEYILVDSGKKKLSTKALQESELASYIKTYSCYYRERSDFFNYAAAYNKGISFSEGRIIIRLSGDAVPVGNNWIKKNLEPFRKKKVGVATGRDIIESQLIIDKYILNKFYKNTLNAFVMPKKKQIFKNMPMVNGPCMAFRRKIWEKHNFNTEWLWGEEMEFVFSAMQQKYYILYDPDIAILHTHELDPNQTLKRIYNDAMLVMKMNQLLRKKIHSDIEELLIKTQEIPFSVKDKSRQYYLNESKRAKDILETYLKEMEYIKNQIKKFLPVSKKS